MTTVFVPWAAAPQVGLFGKVPSAGDFAHLRIGEDQKWCEWLQRGVERASARLGGRWPMAFDAGVAIGFMMRQGPGSIIGGVMRPSHDAVGRRFPLSGYASLSAADAPSVRHLVPWAITAFTQSLAGLFAAAADGALDAVETVRGLTVQPVAGDQGQVHYADWLRNTPALAWFETLWGRKDRELARYSIAMIASALSQYVGQDHSNSPLGLRLPVAGDLRAAAFWIELVARLGAWRTTVPTVFWEALQPETVLIQLGETKPSTYVELWAHGADDEHLVELCSLGAVNAEPFMTGVPAPLQQRLGDDSATLWDILCAAGPSS